MDERLRQLERSDDPQAFFDALRRAGKTSEALALVQYHSIRTVVTLEYRYSYRFLRSSGAWHSHPDYLAKTYEELAPIVAETIRNGYIARSMEMTGDHWQRRGQLIRIPVMLLGENLIKLPCDDPAPAFQIQVCSVDEFRLFMQLVIHHRQAGGKPVPRVVSDRYASLSLMPSLEAGRGGASSLASLMPSLEAGRGGANG